LNISAVSANTKFETLKNSRKRLLFLSYMLRFTQAIWQSFFYTFDVIYF